MIIIQTATPPEFKSLQLAFGKNDVLIAGKRKCFQALPEVFVLSGGLGKTYAAASTEYAIDAWTPRLVIDFGAAGGLVEGLRRGDLVLSAKVIEHDTPPMEKRAEPIDAKCPDVVPPFPEFKTLSDGIRATVGAIAAGEENIETAKERRALAEKFGAVAVTWETASIARVCQLHKVPFASVRMITDIGEGELLEEYKRGVKEHLDRAAATFVRELLPELIEDS